MKEELLEWILKMLEDGHDHTTIHKHLVKNGHDSNEAHTAILIAKKRHEKKIEENTKSLLIKWIEKKLDEGHSHEKLHEHLIKKGHNPKHVKEAIEHVNKQRQDKKHRTMLFGLAGIVIAVLVILIISSIFISTIPKKVIDCGTSMGCFISASENCDLAKVEFTSSIELFEILQTTTSLMEIKGIDSNTKKCEFRISNKDVSLDFSEAMYSELLKSDVPLDDIKTQISLLEKKQKKFSNNLNGVCHFIISDLNSMLVRWSQGSYSTNDYLNADCSGTMFGDGLSCQESGLELGEKVILDGHEYMFESIDENQKVTFSVDGNSKILSLDTTEIFDDLKITILEIIESENSYYLSFDINCDLH